jgi:hypothetical protein
MNDITYPGNCITFYSKKEPTFVPCLIRTYNINPAPGYKNPIPGMLAENSPGK